MNSSEIYKALPRFFPSNTYRYNLMNAYIFQNGWESDYYCQSKAGLDIEVEVKVSRSDFRANFKKQKHKFFAAMLKKQRHFVENQGAARTTSDYELYGKDDHKRFLLKVKVGYLEDTSTRWRLSHWFYATQIRYKWHHVYFPATKIKIHDLSEVKAPQRFFYATPPGMLQPGEIPAYAGLLELHGNELVKIKNAPVIHKYQHDLTGTLLDKFYFNSLGVTSYRDELEREKWLTNERFKNLFIAIDKGRETGDFTDVDNFKKLVIS